MFILMMKVNLFQYNIDVELPNKKASTPIKVVRFRICWYLGLESNRHGRKAEGFHL